MSEMERRLVLVEAKAMRTYSDLASADELSRGLAVLRQECTSTIESVAKSLEVKILLEQDMAIKREVQSLGGQDLQKVPITIGGDFVNIQSLHRLRSDLMGELMLARTEWQDSLASLLSAFQQHQRVSAAKQESFADFGVHEERVREEERRYWQSTWETRRQDDREGLAAVERRLAAVEHTLASAAAPRKLCLDTLQLNVRMTHSCKPCPLEGRVAALISDITGGKEVERLSVEDRVDALAMKVKDVGKATSSGLDGRVATLELQCAQQQAEQQMCRRALGDLERKLHSTAGSG